MKKKQVSSGCIVQADIKGSKLGSGNEEAFTSAGKSTKIVLVPFSHGSVSLQLVLVVWIFLRSLGVICYNR